MAKKHIKTATIITLVIAIFGAAGTALALSWKASKRDSLIIETSDKVAILEPKVEKNTEFRIETAKDIEYMQQGIARIEKHLGTQP